MFSFLGVQVVHGIVASWGVSFPGWFLASVDGFSKQFTKKHRQKVWGLKELRYEEDKNREGTQRRKRSNMNRIMIKFQ